MPFYPGTRFLPTARTCGLYRTIQRNRYRPGPARAMQQPRSGSVPASGNHPAVVHRPGKKPPGPWTTAPLALAFVGPRSLGDVVCAGRCIGMPSATKGVPPLDPQTRAKQPIRVHQVPHHRRSVADAPMAYPPPCLACNGLSRHILGRRLPPVFHDPLHAAQLWIVRAYRDRPTLTSRPPPAARSRAKGLAASAARTR